ncbi:putative bifunctional diguanylate cyclase/phosphodiesterase [Planococcus donghaensis]|uniref:putative bifunctional diguanylate cyclase/phosphodiesterase n=1 Tax=Planococcus donghaensis TaxID=414778 RepID=UPI0009F2A3DA|nr:EAL domain-containing protein [Planococcus donghaensis]
MENLISWLAPIVAFVTLFIVYRKSVGRLRLFWLLLSLGCLSYAIAEGIWVYSYNISHVEPNYPGWPDPFYFLQIFFYLAAFIYHLMQKKENAYQIKFIFDMMIIIAVSTALSWHFLIQLLLPDATASPLLFVVSIGYPVGDLLLLFGAVSLYIGYSYTLSPRVLILIIAGLVFQVFADTAYLYSTVANTYSAESFYNPLWSLSLLLVAFSGLYSLDPIKKSVSGKTFMHITDRISVRMLLPYFSLLMLFIVIIVEESKHTRGLVAGAFVATALIVTRQIFTLRDNRRLLFNYDQLTSELEEKIAQRTVEVTSKNQQLEKVIHQVEHIAYHDELTGLPNRRLFLKNLESSIATADESGKKLAVVFIDLDRFKNINDTFGHEFGDLLLQDFSRKISENLRSVDTISRQGGDEFTLILNNIQDEADITPTIHRIQAAFQQALSIKDQELHVSMSIGIAIYPDNGTSTSELLKHADSAMYSAKAKGKNNYQFFSDDMSLVVSRKIALENELRRALANEEFLLHYQPQFNAHTREITGMEALVRWQTAEDEIISPAHFIPLAEETRLILPLGEWVLNTACEQAKLWHDRGHHHLKLAVNLSPLQFLDDDLLDMVERTLEKTGFPASSLELEITENVAVDDIDLALLRMQALKDLGVNLAIDDFGTGYCSLSYLKKFPLTNLKIAQSFVRDMATNPHDEALVEAMVLIGHKLNMSVIAEGVETEEQLALLKELGCDEIQGYLFSKPLTTDHFSQLLSKELASKNPIH